MPFHQLYLHLVFATAQRAPAIKIEREQALWDAIAGRCRERGCEVLAIGGLPDHVHLLVELSPAVAVESLAREIKEAALAPMAKDFRWQEGYGAATLRQEELAKVVRYVEGQKEQHLRGRLSRLLERTVEQEARG